MYLKINSIEKIETDSDIFIHSDAKGKIIVIKQIGLYNNDNVLVRTVDLNKELISLLKQTKIQL